MSHRTLCWPTLAMRPAFTAVKVKFHGVCVTAWMQLHQNFHVLRLVHSSWTMLTRCGWGLGQDRPWYHKRDVPNTSTKFTIKLK